MRLTLAEELLLIAMDDEAGKLLASSRKNIDKALRSAILLELALRERIKFDEEKKVKVSNESSTYDKLLNDVLKFISKSPEDKSSSSWIETLQKEIKDVKKPVIDRLLQKDILRKEEQKIFWIPVSERFNNENYEKEQEIRERLHEILLRGREPEPKDIMLVNLLHACNLIGEVFKNEEDYQRALKEAEKISNEHPIDATLKATISEIRESLSLS